MNKKYEIGTILNSNKYGSFEIIRINSLNRFRVRFIKTGYEKDISRGCMTHGEVRDPYYPIYYNVACIGDIKTYEYMKEFNVWRFMIQRCYNEKHDGYNLYGEKGVRVSERWLCFENFLKDISSITGYNKEQFYNGELQLDKDTLYDGVGDKIYSVDTCVFLPYKKNFDEMLKRRKTTTTSKYVGVTKLKCGKWQTTYYNSGKYIYGGRHSTEEEAHDAYLKLKEEYNINREEK